jgi:hypothetical protein
MVEEAEGTRRVQRIEVSSADVEGSSSRFHVRVADDDGATEHDVTVSRVDRDRLAGGYTSPEAFIRACFEFLLDREPKESILGSFDVSQIATYFPEFETQILRSTPSG